MVTTICYGIEQKWNSREEAMEDFKECMFHSEGAEHERYEKIYWELEAGYEVASDIEWADYNWLTTVAKVRCLERFVDVVNPFGWRYINKYDINELVEEVKIWLDDNDALTIDYEGNWYDMGRKM